MAVGALIGGTISGATYAIMAGKDFTWKDFGKSFAYGAIGGAVSGGFGAAFAGTSLANSMATNILTTTASYSASAAIMGDPITLNGMIGATVGGMVGGLIPGYQAVDGGSLVNIGAEIGYNSLRGAFSGGIGGGVASVLSGEDFGKGFLNGAKWGVAGEVAQTGLQIIAFGNAIKPTDKNTVKALEEMEKDFTSVSKGIGSYGPVYRSGGLWSVFAPNTDIVMGRNIVMSQEDQALYVHETAHYYQQNEMGWANFQGRGAYEQWFVSRPYTTPGNIEFAARQLFEKTYGR